MHRNVAVSMNRSGGPWVFVPDIGTRINGASQVVLEQTQGNEKGLFEMMSKMPGASAM